MSEVKKKSLSEQVFTGITWTYASAILNAVMHLGVLSVLARMLLPSEFGLLGMALIFISFAERIGQVGVGPAIVQKETIVPRDYQVAATVGMICGITISLLFWIVAPVASEFFNEPKLVPILQVLSLVFIAEGFGMVSDSRLQRELRFKSLFIAENTAYFLGNGVLAIYLAYSGYGVWALVWGYLATRIIRALIVFKITPQSMILSFSFNEARDLLKFGFGFSLGRILNFCALYGDNAVIGRWLGAEALGLYSRAYQLMTLPSVYFAQIIDRVMFPGLSKKQGSQQHLKKGYLLTIDAIALVSMPVSVVMFLASEEIVVFLLGPRWTDMVSVLSVLSLGIFARTAYKAGDTLARATGAVYQHAWRQAVYTLLVICGSLIAVRFGLRAVAYSVLIAVTYNYIQMSLLSMKILNLDIKSLLLSHVPGIWISFWIAITTYITVESMRDSNLNAFIKLCLIGVCALVTMLVALKTAPVSCRPPSVLWLNQRLTAVSAVPRPFIRILNYFTIAG